MRHLFATSTLALALTAPLWGAQAQTTFNPDIEVTNQDIYAASFINQTVYATETEIVEGIRFAENELTAVGEIDDVIMTQDGTVKGVVLGVGGIMEIGEKNVLVQFDDLNFVPAENGDGSFMIVLQTTAEQVEDAPEYEYNDLMQWWTG